MKSSASEAAEGDGVMRVARDQVLVEPYLGRLINFR